MSSPTSSSQSTDETVRCKGHNLPARIWTSNSGNNPGREFYKCPKETGDPERCNFFAWVDETLGPSSSQGRNNPLPPTPQSSKINRPHTQPEPPSTPTHSQPLKRSYSALEGSGHDNETLNSAQKRSRLEAIQEALAEKNSFSSQVNASSSTPTHTNSSQPRPSIPSNRKVDPPLQDPFSDAASGGVWPPHTPSRPHRATISAVTPSPSPMATRGSQQSLMSCNADNDSSSQVTLSDDDGLTSESIARMVRRFQSLPDYVRKLERKKVAAEKSRDAKDSKIAYLEAEVHRLRAREKELEEVIAAYEGK